MFRETSTAALVTLAVLGREAGRAARVANPSLRWDEPSGGGRRKAGRRR